MCQTEDVYHTRCGHWSDKPQVHQPCVRMRDQPESSSRSYSRRAPSPRPCHASQKSRSRTDRENKCPKCRIDVDKIASKQSGMWFSVSQDPVTGRTKYKDREGESYGSWTARHTSSGKGKKLTKNPPKQSKRGQSQKARQDSEEEEETTRNNSWSSWSSHGHVEL